MGVELKLKLIRSSCELTRCRDVEDKGGASTFATRARWRAGSNDSISNIGHSELDGDDSEAEW